MGQREYRRGEVGNAEKVTKVEAERRRGRGIKSNKGRPGKRRNLQSLRSMKRHADRPQLVELNPSLI